MNPKGDHYETVGGNFDAIKVRIDRHSYIYFYWQTFALLCVLEMASISPARSKVHINDAYGTRDSTFYGVTIPHGNPIEYSLARPLPYSIHWLFAFLLGATYTATELHDYVIHQWDWTMSLSAKISLLFNCNPCESFPADVTLPVKEPLQGKKSRCSKLCNDSKVFQMSRGQFIRKY